MPNHVALDSILFGELINHNTCMPYMYFLPNFHAVWEMDMPLIARTPKLPCFNQWNHLTINFKLFPIVVKKTHSWDCSCKFSTQNWREKNRHEKEGKGQEVMQTLLILLQILKRPISTTIYWWLQLLNEIMLIVNFIIFI